MNLKIPEIRKFSVQILRIFTEILKFLEKKITDFKISDRDFAISGIPFDLLKLAQILSEF